MLVLFSIIDLTFQQQMSNWDFQRSEKQGTCA